MLRQRQPRQHDAAHVAYVRTQPCCACPKASNRQSEAAHIRMACLSRGKEPTGMQEKPDDRWTVPLCAYHHRTGIDAQHVVGEQVFWSLRGVDPFALAIRLWIESGGAARAALPSPVKKPRKIRQRDRTKPKRRIQSNPVIQSRDFDPRRRKMCGRSQWASR